MARHCQVRFCSPAGHGPLRGGGATAFLRKASPFDALLSTIDRSFRDADDSRLARLAALTPREQEVLEALMAGHTAARIAEDSYVSIRTVRTHIEAIHRKLGVKSQLSGVAFAAKWVGRERAEGRSAAVSATLPISAGIGSLADEISGNPAVPCPLPERTPAAVRRSEGPYLSPGPRGASGETDAI